MLRVKVPRSLNISYRLKRQRGSRRRNGAPAVILSRYSGERGSQADCSCRRLAPRAAAGCRIRLMKGVILQVSEEALARRRQTGVDRYDEMWEGALHMAPAPAYEHQRIV